MIIPAIRALMNLPNACIGCRLPEPAISNPTRFVRGEIELILCQICAIDYLEWCGETIEETVARSDADPRELIWWGTKH